ncbi:XRN 5'-3' exonuclease N-terminus-domain-containing protein [Entophlyctis helioformis]|nr:XRN 5'-3' exonuclease N-terminus-domain-containing protein [Entophlyctis helioformis]
MGLPHLRKWLKETVPGCIRGIERAAAAAGSAGSAGGSAPAAGGFDHVFIDLNSILHQQARRAKTPADTKKRLVGAIKRVMNLPSVQPRKQVFLAIDGPPPLAKMRLQRQRRISLGVKKKKTAAAAAFDTRQITPGCLFMDSMEEYLASFACRHLVLSCNRTPGLAIAISGAACPGEGELKIIHTIRSMQADPHIKNNESFAIIGSDADLVLQAIASGISCSILDDRGVQSVSLPDLFKFLHSVCPKRDPQLVGLDFAVLTVLAGNDYFPKVRGVSLGSLWTRYRNYAASKNFHHIFDADSRTLNPIALAHIFPIRKNQGDLQGLADGAVAGEDEDADDLNDVDDDDDTNSDADPMEMDADQDADVALAEESAATPAAIGSVASFVPTLNIPEQSAQMDMSSDAQVHTYFQGILWCITMYRTGQCPDHAFLYRWKYAPSSSQIALFLKTGMAMILEPSCKQFIDPPYASIADHPTGHTILYDAYQQIQSHYSKQGAIIPSQPAIPFTLMLFPRWSVPPGYTNYIPTTDLLGGPKIVFNRPFCRYDLAPGQSGVVSGNGGSQQLHTQQQQQQQQQQVKEDRQQERRPSDQQQQQQDRHPAWNPQQTTVAPSDQAGAPRQQRRRDGGKSNHQDPPMPDEQAAQPPAAIQRQASTADIVIPDYKVPVVFRQPGAPGSGSSFNARYPLRNGGRSPQQQQAQSQESDHAERLPLENADRSHRPPGRAGRGGRGGRGGHGGGRREVTGDPSIDFA